MSDIMTDPYAGVESKEERQAIYQRLQEQYKVEFAAWEREQKEAEYRRTIYDDHMKTWHHQREIQIDVDTRFHKSMLTIAAGSFGVSFAFISQIVPLNTAVGKTVMVAAWAFFGLAIVLSLLELKIDSVIQDIFLNNIEKNLKCAYMGKQYKKTNRIITMWPGRIISWLSFLSFGVGLICLIYFVLVNMVSR